MSLPRPDADRELDTDEIEGQPYGEIMTALEELPDEESLLITNSFEPEPLYAVLEQQGFEYETTNPESDVWYVKVTHE